MTGRSAIGGAVGNRNANHADAQRWHEELWCPVHDTHALRSGFPDMVVRTQTAMGEIPAPVAVKISVVGDGPSLSENSEVSDALAGLPSYTWGM